MNLLCETASSNDALVAIALRIRAPSTDVEKEIARRAKGSRMREEALLTLKASSVRDCPKDRGFREGGNRRGAAADQAQSDDQGQGR